MKNILIAGYQGYSKVSQVENFVQSFKNVRRNQDELVVAYAGKRTAINDYLDSFDWVTTIKMKPTLNHKYVDRFKWYSDILSESEAERALCCDFTDVIFQENPFKWMEINQTKDIIVCDEQVKHINKHEDWNLTMAKLAFPEQVKDLENKNVLNVGVVGGRTERVKNVLKSVYEKCKFPVEVVESEIELIPDQAAYSLLMHTTDYRIFGQKVGNTDTYCITMGMVVSIPLFKIVAGKICNQKGVPYCIVHQYNRHSVINYDPKNNGFMAGDDNTAYAIFNCTDYDA
jgi:choline kinase